MTSLPGFDLWLTTQPEQEAIEPSQQNFQDARAKLSEGPLDEELSEDEIYNLACMYAMNDAYNAKLDAEDAEISAEESRRESLEDRYGDGPL